MSLKLYDTAAPSGEFPAVMAHHVGLPNNKNVLEELDRISEILTAFFNSDDKSLDQLSEIVNYIVRNKTLIDAVAKDVSTIAQSTIPDILPGAPVLEPETYYEFGSVDSLEVTLAEKVDGKAHEYMFEFVPGESFQGLTITPEPQWIKAPQYPAGRRCVVSIIRGVGVTINV